MSKLRALTMPKWGIEMTEGRISEWNIADGDSISKGQVIALIETDKIVNDLEAELDANVARLVAEVGETYPVGALLAVLATQPAFAEEVETFVRSFRAAAGSTAATVESSGSAGGSAAKGAAAAGGSPERTSTTTSSVRIPDGIAISPAALELALERNVDVTGLQGTGRGGRITLQDVDQALKRAPPAAGPSPGSTQQPGIERFSPMRKAIARQLTTAKTTIPHFYLRMSVSMDAVVALREQAKKEGGSAPSLNDYLLRAAALALVDSPGVNIQVHGDEIHRFADADIAVAVATDRGLITPIVRAANTKSVAAIASEVRDLAERARSGKLRAEEYSGGTFSVSNLGMYGIDEFDAIINPPQGAILAVGAARHRPVDRSGSVQLATTVNLSLSCDHRAIDGATGAQFLAMLRELLERPDRL